MPDSKQHRSRFYLQSFIFLVIVTLVLFFLNLMSDRTSRLKVDLSEDGLYTVSPAAADILSRLKDTIRVTYYSSQEIESFRPNLPRDTADMFEEFRRISGGKFRYEVIDPKKERDEFAARKAEEYLEKKEAGNIDDLEEPELPRNPMQMFGPRKPPTPEEIREQRDQLAAEIASQTGRDKSEVYRNRLLQEFQDVYERKLEQEGVLPVLFQDRKADSVRQVKVYSAIKITYLDEPPEVLPQHDSLEGLEYDLCHRIVKLTSDDKPTIAFFDARKPPMPEFNPQNPMQRPPASDYSGIIGLFRQLFDVREVSLEEGDAFDDLLADLKREKDQREAELKGEDPPEDEGQYDEIADEDFALLKCLIVAQPDALEERQKYEINRAVSLGVRTVFLVSPYSLDVSPAGMQQDFPIESLDPALQEMFAEWGVSLGSEILASNEKGIIVVPTRVRDLPIRMQQAMPLNVLVATEDDRINQESPYTNRISRLVFPATPGIRLDREKLEKNGIAADELARTSEEVWSVSINPYERLQNPMMRNQGMGMSLGQYWEDLGPRPKEKDFRGFLDEPRLLAVSLAGKFPFTYEGEPVPEWEKKDEPEEGGPSVGGPPGFGEGDTLPDADDPLQEESAGDPAEDAGADTSEGGSPETEESTAGDGAAGGETAGEGAAADEEEAPREIAHVEPVENSVVVLSSADMLKDQFLQYRNYDPGYQSNITLFHTTAELFGLDDGERLARIRRKNQTARYFEPDSERYAEWILWGNVLGIPLLVAAIGLIRYITRRSGSVRYEREYIQSHAG